MTSDKSAAGSKPQLSIIIISYNTKDITLSCLTSIYKSFEHIKSPTFEIIVIDNHSTDGSIESLKNFQKNHSNFKLIENKENVGFGKANNQGVAQSQGEYLLFLNSDTVILDNAIETLFNFYNANPHIHFLGPKLLEKDGKTSQPSAAPFYTLPVIFAFLLMFGDRLGITRWSPDYTQEVDWVSGACILTKKEYFLDVGRFDESIFMYMDEVDLLYRAKKKNYRVFFYPGAQIIHIGSASSEKTYPILQAYKGFIFFYKKHYPSWQLYVLKYILLVKAGIGLSIGKLIHNSYLIKTYGEALKIAAVVGQ